MPRPWQPTGGSMAAPTDSLEPAGFAEAAAAVADLIVSARQQFDLCSAFLPPRIFDTPPVVDAIRQFAAGSPKNQARLLILQPRQVTVRPHPFVLMAQSLPDTFFLHSLPQRIAPPADDFLLNDRGNGMRFPQPGRSTFVRTDGHSQSWLQGVFEELWRHSEPVPELRRFLL